MTGAEVLDAILADAFPSSRRPLALVCANAALGWMYGIEEWVWRYASSAVTVNAGSYDLDDVPADFGIPVALFDSRGRRLTEIAEHRDFAARFLGTGNERSGVPRAFAVIGGGIVVGPKPSVTDEGFLLEYERAFPAMADDSTELPVPSEAQLAVVAGGKARTFVETGAAAEASPLFALEAATIDGLRRNYLRSVRGDTEQVPAYRPGIW